jgi:endonuclease/exonuclease/phosphatase family metal-dependent hydrolase
MSNESARNGLRGWLAVALAVLSVAASLPWAFAYLLPQPSTAVLGLAGLAGFSPYAVFALLVLTWALRQWRALLVSGVLLAGQVVTIGPQYVGDEAPRAGERVLRFMTVNLFFGRADTAQVVRLVRERRIDVLALEELSPGAVAGLERAGLRRELPFALNRARPGAEGTGLWSRLPLTDVAVLQMRFHSVAADLDLGDRVLRVRAVHPVPPIPVRSWRRDMALLRAQLASDRRVQTVVLGDLNSSVHHREFRRLLDRRWRDAAEVEGAGLVRTWTPRRGAPAVLDLDHVLVDRGMTVHGFQTVAIRGGDHRAVIAAVGVPART